jgi:hypothetical protein
MSMGFEASFPAKFWRKFGLKTSTRMNQMAEAWRKEHATSLIRGWKMTPNFRQTSAQPRTSVFSLSTDAREREAIRTRESRVVPDGKYCDTL